MLVKNARRVGCELSACARWFSPVCMSTPGATRRSVVLVELCWKCCTEKCICWSHMWFHIWYWKLNDSKRPSTTVAILGGGVSLSVYTVVVHWKYCNYAVLIALKYFSIAVNKNLFIFLHDSAQVLYCIPCSFVNLNIALLHAVVEALHITIFVFTVL